MALYLYALGLIALLLSIADYANALSGPICASCHAPVKSHHQCSQRIACAHNQVCAVSKALFPHGETLYHYYCADQDECDAKHARHRYPHDAHLLCIDCCSDVRCFKNLCHDDSHASLASTQLPHTTPTVTQLGPHTCATCQGIADPTLCNQFKDCTRSENCLTEVNNNLYYMSCTAKNRHCPEPGLDVLIGKKRRSEDQEDHVTCRQCCHGGLGCNRLLCLDAVATNTHAQSITTPASRVSATTTTTSTPTPSPPPLTPSPPSPPTSSPPTPSPPIPTPSQRTPSSATTSTTQSSPTPTPSPPPTTTSTTSTTQATTTTEAFTATKHNGLTTQGTAGDQCRNKEEDGISCSSLDLLHICSDPSTFAYVLARQKCPKHCGFCKSTTQTSPVHIIPPPDGVCADYEQDGIKCSSLDLFHLCTGTSTLEYVIAHKKCSKHCGFCTPLTSG